MKAIELDEHLYELTIDTLINIVASRAGFFDE